MTPAASCRITWIEKQGGDLQRRSVPDARHRGRRPADQVGHRQGTRNAPEAEDRNLRRARRRRRKRQILPPGRHELRQRVAVPRAHLAPRGGPSRNRGKEKEEKVAYGCCHVMGHVSGRHLQKEINAEETENRVGRPTGQQRRQLPDRSHRLKQRRGRPIHHADSDSDRQPADRARAFPSRTRMAR